MTFWVASAASGAVGGSRMDRNLGLEPLGGVGWTEALGLNRWASPAALRASSLICRMKTQPPERDRTAGAGSDRSAS